MSVTLNTIDSVPSFEANHFLSRNTIFFSFGGTAMPITYLMRAWDSGLNTYVYWTSETNPNTAPTSGITSPNYTGTLSAVTVVRQY